VYVSRSVRSTVRPQRVKDGVAQDLVLADVGLVMVGGAKLDVLCPGDLTCRPPSLLDEIGIRGPDADQTRGAPPRKVVGVDALEHDRVRRAARVA
jgi:hypothetical protein